MTRLTGVCDSCGVSCGPAFVRCTPCNRRQLDDHLTRARSDQTDTEEDRT